MRITLVDVELRFIHLGKGIIIPVVMEGGYVTVNSSGYIEMWYSKPQYWQGQWQAEGERGVDLGTLDSDIFANEVSTMCFDFGGERVV